MCAWIIYIRACIVVCLQSSNKIFANIITYSEVPMLKFWKLFWSTISKLCLTSIFSRTMNFNYWAIDVWLLFFGCCCKDVSLGELYNIDTCIGWTDFRDGDEPAATNAQQEPGSRKVVVGATVHWSVHFVKRLVGIAGCCFSFVNCIFSLNFVRQELVSLDSFVNFVHQVVLLLFGKFGLVCLKFAFH